MASSRAHGALGARPGSTQPDRRLSSNMPSSEAPKTSSTPRSLDLFHKLVTDLSRLLGPSSGINSDDIDVQELQSLMENYTSNTQEWCQYAFSDHSRGYTRNLVDEGNGKSNLLILVWSPGRSSAIHDHANAHYIMKVLQGSLKETRFQTPEAENMAPDTIQETLFKKDQVTYMSDALGLHKISNPDSEETAVSLHLYTPPNAAREGCNVFNERTGKKSHVTQSNFYSIYGRKVTSTK